jgi:hypothetical protein
VSKRFLTPSKSKKNASPRAPGDFTFVTGLYSDDPCDDGGTGDDEVSFAGFAVNAVGTGGDPL